jgi:hypothetical protein
MKFEIEFLNHEYSKTINENIINLIDHLYSIKNSSKIFLFIYNSKISIVKHAIILIYC